MAGHLRQRLAGVISKREEHDVEGLSVCHVNRHFGVFFFLILYPLKGCLFLREVCVQELKPS